MQTSHSVSLLLLVLLLVSGTEGQDVGATCGANGACNSGLVCDHDNTCKIKADGIQLCSNTAACALYSTCGGDPGDEVCTCNADFQADGGLCYAKLGKACDANKPCSTGLSCSNSVCVTTPPPTTTTQPPTTTTQPPTTTANQPPDTTANQVSVCNETAAWSCVDQYKSHVDDYTLDNFSSLSQEKKDCVCQAVIKVKECVDGHLGDCGESMSPDLKSNKTKLDSFSDSQCEDDYDMKDCSNTAGGYAGFTFSSIFLAVLVSCVF